MLKLNKKTQGFSLIELSIVLIIVALLIAGIVSGKSLITNAKLTVLNSEMNTLKIALGSYINDNGITDFKIATDTEGAIKSLEEIQKAGYLDANTINVANAGAEFYKSKFNGGGWYYEPMTDDAVLDATTAKNPGLQFGKGGGTAIADLLECQASKTFATKYKKDGSIVIANKVTTECTDNTAQTVNVSFLNGAQ